VSARPLVTVYLPTHNRAQLLGRAIESVLGQSHAELELLIVDDASSDGTPEQLERAARQDGRIRVLRRESAGGPAAARNDAIRCARGEFITGLDDDDRMLPRHIERLLGAYRDEHSLVCSSCWLDYGGWLRPEPAGPELITLDQLLHSNQIGNQVLTRTSRLLEVGLFDESLAAWEDYDLWTRLVLRFGPARRLNEPGTIRRVDPTAPRITTSSRAPLGARQYVDRYQHLMSDSQRRSQQLLQCSVDERRLGLAEARRCWGPGTRSQVLRTWVAGNLPFSRGLREAWWRLRYRRAGPART
jgi:glycosyltransferase involved in cell wall biosynthesis